MPLRGGVCGQQLGLIAITVLALNAVLAAIPSRLEVYLFDLDKAAVMRVLLLLDSVERPQ